jgi:peroxiredoxin Q/BCP
MAKAIDPADHPELVQPGKAAPAISLKDQDGNTQSLKDYKGKFVVLYFYPKDDTPGCTTEACQFRDGIADFTKRNAVVLGVSPDDEKSHAKFAGKFSLPFPLLADTERTVCEKYGVWQEKQNYGKTYMGVVRTTYLIGSDGKVAFVWPKVSAKGHDQEVLAKLDELAK